MRIPLYQIDSFADAPFRGNPAAVCVLPAGRPLPDATMQAVAAELNLPATAFVSPRQARTAPDLRWFAPLTEIFLCGHATIASFHALREHGVLGPEESARFQTKAGELTARPAHGSGEGSSLLELDFPAIRSETAAPPAGLLEALGLSNAEVLRGPTDYLVVVDDEAIVRGLSPDFEAMRRIDMRGAIVTARSARDGVDFVSRFFCPSVGVNEDPATGSAHCALAVYWAHELGREQLVGHQASRRTARIETALRGDRVLLRGHAVTVSQGSLRLDLG